MKSNDKGSIVVESVLLVPVMMMLVLLVVYLGRWTTSSHRIHHAADVAARVASQMSLSKMTIAAQKAASQELGHNSSNCGYPLVVVTPFKSENLRFVRVDVSCTVKTVDLGLLKLPTRRITATSTEVVDYYTNR